MSSPETAPTFADSIEGHKEIMRFIVESNDARQFDAYTHLLTDDFVGHNHFVPGDLHGKQSLGEFFYVTEQIAFPDGVHTIHQLYGEGDLVTLELSYEGTFTGPLPNGTTPNGKVIRFHYNIICRFVDGKLAELTWFPFDSFSLMSELGMI
ncbi:ester cyclase [Spirosoma gilvum]